MSTRTGRVVRWVRSNGTRYAVIEPHLSSRSRRPRSLRRRRFGGFQCPHRHDRELYGIFPLLIGVTMVMPGAAVIRAGQWQGWRQLVPLILGVYVFVPMTPALFGPHELARFAIGSWMLGFAFLGWPLVQTAQETTPAPEMALRMGG